MWPSEDSAVVVWNLGAIEALTAAPSATALAVFRAEDHALSALQAGAVSPHKTTSSSWTFDFSADTPAKPHGRAVSAAAKIESSVATDDGGFNSNSGTVSGYAAVIVESPTGELGATSVNVLDWGYNTGEGDDRGWSILHEGVVFHDTTGPPATGSNTALQNAGLTLPAGRASLFLFLQNATNKTVKGWALGKHFDPSA